MKEADIILFIYAAPAGDETLKPDVAVHILEEILPAKNHSYVLGLKLELPKHVVDGIHSRELKPEGYLLEVISEFLNEVGSRPTWRVIVDALRSPVVRLNQLANEVETAHFPDATAIREVVPTSTPTGIASLSLCIYFNTSYSLHIVPLSMESTQSPAARRKIGKSLQSLIH